MKKWLAVGLLAWWFAFYNADNVMIEIWQFDKRWMCETVRESVSLEYYVSPKCSEGLWHL